MFYPMLEALFARRVHWLKSIGIACGLVSLFFAFRNYHFGNAAGREERGLVSYLARLLGRNID